MTGGERKIEASGRMTVVRSPVLVRQALSPVLVRIGYTRPGSGMPLPREAFVTIAHIEPSSAFSRSHRMSPSTEGRRGTSRMHARGFP